MTRADELSRQLDNLRDQHLTLDEWREWHQLQYDASETAWGEHPDRGPSIERHQSAVARLEQWEAARPVFIAEWRRLTDELRDATPSHLAELRLQSLDLPAHLIEDASGQTSETEHLTWLATAPEAEIRQWVQDLER